MNVTPATGQTSIHSAIAAASQRTGVDFTYLIGQAQVESGMRTDARARTSTATGLYQFIEQSWLAVVKKHGAEHGLGWAADSIRQTAGGRYVVGDDATRQAILQLRTDPQAASLMAAEHAADNKAALETHLGREATGTDLYMAHFLGLGGARQFLGAMANDPERSGAAMFPAAARANRAIFYGSGGQPRSLGDIYELFAAKLDRGAARNGVTGLASGRFERVGPLSPVNSTAQAAQAMAALGNVDVVLGNNATSDGDRQWLASTLDQLNAANRRANVQNAAYRPTPETARLAYLLLASLGA